MSMTEQEIEGRRMAARQWQADITNTAGELRCMIDDLADELAALRAAPDAPDREALGRIVREEWVRCATEHGDAPPHHLTPWEALDERNKEIDRRIGEAVARAVVGPDARLREALAHIEDRATAIADEYGNSPFMEGILRPIAKTARDALRGEGDTNANH